MRWFIGIDPGRTGAMVALNLRGDYVPLILFSEFFGGEKGHDKIEPYKAMRTFEVLRLGNLMVERMQTLENFLARETLIFLEMPFSFQAKISGRNQSMLHYYAALKQGVLSWYHSDLNIWPITPDQWKGGVLGRKKASKEDASAAYLDLFPKRKARDGEIDAALIALYGRRLWETHKSTNKITKCLTDTKT